MDVPIIVFQMAKLREESEQSKGQSDGPRGGERRGVGGRRSRGHSHGDDAGVLGALLAAGHLEGRTEGAVHVDLLRGGDHMVGRTLGWGRGGAQYHVTPCKLCRLQLFVFLNKYLRRLQQRRVIRLLFINGCSINDEDIRTRYQG